VTGQAASEGEKKLLSLLFLAAKDKDFKVILDSLIGATHDQISQRDGRILANWQLLAKAKVAEAEAVYKREAFEKILPMMAITSVEISEANIDQFYLPMLELQASILDTDKPILWKEAEAFCVTQSVLLKLDQVLAKVPERFNVVWSAVFNVISTAFHR
jgi:hypothetical protein